MRRLSLCLLSQICVCCVSTAPSNGHRITVGYVVDKKAVELVTPKILDGFKKAASRAFREECGVTVGGFQEIPLDDDDRRMFPFTNSEGVFDGTGKTSPSWVALTNWNNKARARHKDIDVFVLFAESIL